jgi:nucleotide-binding universal stress UspA family protein
MAIRDIVVSLDATPASEVRLRLALRLARQHKAHLSAAYTMADGPAASAGIGFGAPVQPDAGPPRAAERAEQAEQQYATESRLAGVEGDWHLIESGDKADLIDLIKACDLVILGQQSSDGASRIAPDDIVVEIGRPVLLVPYVGNFKSVGRRVLIAWDATREATRALNDALPLIEAAEEVTVVHVAAQEAGLGKMRPALERIVRHLERHGVKAQPEETLKGDLAISDLLLSRAADLDADMIVAGAYHHSPLREALLGGVSRELLRHMTVPVLMSH